MFKKLSKAGKILLLSLTTAGVGTVAYTHYSQLPHKQHIDPIASGIQQKQSIIGGNVAGRVGEGIEGRSEEEKGKEEVKVVGEGEKVVGKGNGQGQHHGHRHQHDTDIRVMDMIGFPSVHGASILEEEPQQVEVKSVEVVAVAEQSSSQKQNNQSNGAPIEQKITIVQTPAQSLSQPSVQPQTQPSQQSPSQQLLEQPQQQQQPQSKQPQPSQQQPSQQQPSPQYSQPYKYSPKTPLKSLTQIPLLTSPTQLSLHPYILLILDPGYTSHFESQLTTKITKIIKSRHASQPLAIYRVNTRDKNILGELEKSCGVRVKEEDIYLLRNPYQGGFVNVDFQMFLKHAAVPSVYLSQVRGLETEDAVKRELMRMSPNDTYLLLAYDNTDPQTLKKTQLLAKYIQLQLSPQTPNIKLHLIPLPTAKSTCLLPQTTPPNTLHLLRKSNEFTFKPPNRYLFDQPFHVIENVSLQDRARKLLLPRYLRNVETFCGMGGMGLESKFVCVVGVDRNRVGVKEERELLGVLGGFRQRGEFPMISFVLKFGQVEYKGAKQQQFSHKRWSLKLANIDQMDKHSFLHDIKTPAQASQLGITQKTWLRDSHQYLYKQPEITEEGVRNFFNKVLQGQQPQFYKSQAKFKLQHVDKLTGEDFDEVVFGDRNNSHLVFQYSDHCPACQALSPLIQHLSEISKKFPTQTPKIHRLNSQKNHPKSQPYSPYTPNLYYYSKNWQNRTPIRYPLIQYINYTNIWGIYDFCVITEKLGKIDLRGFQEHLRNVMGREDI